MSAQVLVTFLPHMPFIRPDRLGSVMPYAVMSMLPKNLPRLDEIVHLPATAMTDATDRAARSLIVKGLHRRYDAEGQFDVFVITKLYPAAAES